GELHVRVPGVADAERISSWILPKPAWQPLHPRQLQQLFQRRGGRKLFELTPIAGNWASGIGEIEEQLDGPNQLVRFQLPQAHRVAPPHRYYLTSGEKTNPDVWVCASFVNRIGGLHHF